MVIKTLYLDHFGKFHHKVLPLDPGGTLFLGKNESGKSTIVNFIYGMFFDFIKDHRKNIVYTEKKEKYRPKTGQGYSGRMDVELGGTIYRLERNFEEKKESLKIFDHTGREVTEDFIDDPGSRIPQCGKKMLGISAGNFRHSAMLFETETEVPGKDRELDLFWNGVVGERLYRPLEEQLEKLGNPRRKSSPLGRLYAEGQRVDDKLRECLQRLRFREGEERKLYRLNEEIGDIKEALDRIKVEHDPMAQARKELRGLERELEKLPSYPQGFFEDRDRYIRLVYREEPEPWIPEENSRDPLKYGSIFLLLLMSFVVILGILLKSDGKILLLYSVFLGGSGIVLMRIRQKKEERRRFDEKEKNRRRENDRNAEKAREKEKDDFHQKYPGLSMQDVMDAPYLYGKRQSLEEKRQHLLESLRSGTFPGSFDPEREELQRQLEEKLKEQIRREGERKALDIFVEERRDLLEKQWEIDEEIRALEKEKRGMELGLEALKEAARVGAIHHRLDFNRRFSQWVEIFTLGRYSDPKWEDQVLTVFHKDSGQRFTQDRLSHGTKDQVYLGYRLTLAMDFGESQVPLIFDDVFLSFDEERRDEGIRHLFSQTGIPQVLIFSGKTEDLPKNALGRVRKLEEAYE